MEEEEVTKINDNSEATISNRRKSGATHFLGFQHFLMGHNSPIYDVKVPARRIGRFDPLNRLEKGQCQRNKTVGRYPTFPSILLLSKVVFDTLGCTFKKLMRLNRVKFLSNLKIIGLDSNLLRICKSKFDSKGCLA